MRPFGVPRALAPTAVSLAALLPAPGAAQTWVVGDTGLTWESQAQTRAGLVTRPGSALGPGSFTLQDNVVLTVQWTEGAPRDYVASGQGHVWNNAAVAGSPGVVVDGDSTTGTADQFREFGVDQTGRIFFLDLGASYPASRIVFFPSPQARDDFIRSFELAISDGRTYHADDTPVYRSLKRVDLNREWLVSTDFPGQLLRFLRLRVLSSNPFELGEIQVFGEGYVPRGRYVSRLIQLPGPANLGSLAIRTSRVGSADAGGVAGPEAPVAVSVQLRNGADDTPFDYYQIVDREEGLTEQVSAAVYEGLQQDLKGPVRPDLVNWTPWTEPLTADSTGDYTVPLELPGPRSWFQFRLFFEGTTTGAMEVDRLWLTYSPPLALQALAEIALLSDPMPPEGIAAVPAGVDTAFTYDVRADLGASPASGFDGIRIATPSEPRFLELEMGDPATTVAPDSVRLEPSGMRVYFPSHRVTRGRDERLRITFSTQLYVYGTLFSGQLLDTQGRLPQIIVGGDASQSVGTDQLLVIFAGDADRLLPSVDLTPPVITPNGDGRNDQATLSFDLLHLVQETPVTISLQDLSGRKLKDLYRGELSAGSHSRSWDGTDARGTPVPPGVYLLGVTVHAAARAEHRFRAVNVAY